MFFFRNWRDKHFLSCHFLFLKARNYICFASLVSSMFISTRNTSGDFSKSLLRSFQRKPSSYNWFISSHSRIPNFLIYQCIRVFLRPLDSLKKVCEWYNNTCSYIIILRYGLKKFSITVCFSNVHPHKLKIYPSFDNSYLCVITMQFLYY